ncbi:MAG: thioredoxin domain-containing protein [Candidatus Saccharimonadales bacterium]
MKSQKIWIIVGVLAVLIGGAIWFAMANKEDMPVYTQPGATTTIINENGEEVTVPGAGAYVKYSPETFANTEGRRWLFFHAGWCPQCRALQKDIGKNGVPDGVTIFEVNYDTENDLKKKYGVTLQTTIVEVDENGNEVQKFVAYDDPTIEAVMNALGG